MSSQVRVTCDSCGDQTLATSNVRCRVCLDNNNSEYRFTCPGCDQLTIKQTEPRVINLLEAGGVKVDTWKLPRELRNNESLARITHDDIIDFHEAIGDESLVAEAFEHLHD